MRMHESLKELEPLADRLIGYKMFLNGYCALQYYAYTDGVGALIKRAIYTIR